MGNETTELEKDIAVLKAQMEILTKAFYESMERIEKKLERRDESFITKDVLEEKFKLRDRDIEDLKDTVEKMQKEQFADSQTKKQSMPNWIMAVLSGTSTIVAIAAILVAAYK